MNKYLLPVIVTFVLVAQGCATTPSEIRALGVRGQVEINQPYTEAASCLMRYIDGKVNEGISRKRVIHHTLRIDQDGGYAEIIALRLIGDQITGYEDMIYGTYVVDIRPSGPNSSTVKIYVSNNVVLQGAVTDHLKQAASNCNR